MGKSVEYYTHVDGVISSVFAYVDGRIFKWTEIAPDFLGPCWMEDQYQDIDEFREFPKDYIFTDDVNTLMNSNISGHIDGPWSIERTWIKDDNLGFVKLTK